MLLFREFCEPGLADECSIMIDDKESLEKPGVKVKEEYFPPTLTDYGCISKLTRGGLYAGSDGQGTNVCTPGNPVANPEPDLCS